MESVNATQVFSGTKVCFEKDGYIYCNAIERDGKLIPAKDKWFRFPVYTKKKKTKRS